MDSQQPSSSVGIIIENGDPMALNGDVKLTNGCGPMGEEDEGSGELPLSHSHTKSRRRRQQRKLSGMDEEIIRLVGQHLREMGLQ